MKVTDRGGRWLLVTFELPTRSKAGKSELSRFQNRLVTLGYVPLHRHAYMRHLPPRAKIATETNKLTKGIPNRGVIYVLEVPLASRRRGLFLTDGATVLLDPPPELLTVH